MPKGYDKVSAKIGLRNQPAESDAVPRTTSTLFGVLRYAINAFGAGAAAILSTVGAWDSAATGDTPVAGDTIFGRLRHIITRIKGIDDKLGTPSSTISSHTNRINANYGATEKANINHITANYATAQKNKIDGSAQEATLTANVGALGANLSAIPDMAKSTGVRGTDNIFDAVQAVTNERLTIHANNPAVVSEDEEYRFSVTLIDNDTGPIPIADITPGTYDLIRDRAGVQTNIAVAQAFSKVIGMVYAEITFADGNWNPDDTHIIKPAFDTTVILGGTTYYVPMPGWSGLVSNLSSLEGKIDSILLDTGTTIPASLGNTTGDMSAVSPSVEADLSAFLQSLMYQDRKIVGIIIGDKFNPTTDEQNIYDFIIDRGLQARFIDDDDVDDGDYDFIDCSAIIVTATTTHAGSVDITKIDEIKDLNKPLVCTSPDVYESIFRAMTAAGGGTDAAETQYNVVNNTYFILLDDVLGAETIYTAAGGIRYVTTANLVAGGLSLSQKVGDATRTYLAVLPAGQVDDDANVWDFDRVFWGMYDTAKWNDDLFGHLSEMILTYQKEFLTVIVAEKVNTYKKLFGNMGGNFNQANPLVEYIAGLNNVGTRLPDGKSIRDIVGTNYVDAAGGFNTENVGDDLNDIMTEVAGLNGDAMRGTENAALAATALSDAVWIDAKAAFLDAKISEVVKQVALTGHPADSIGKILFDLYNTRITANVATEAKQDIIDGIVDDIKAGGGFGGDTVTKAVTFTNTNADVNLFTVTGDVLIRIVAVCKTICASAGGCNVGVGNADDDDAIIPETDVTLLNVGEIWHDSAPDSTIESLSTMRDYINTTSKTIILDVEPAKQVDSGAITFYAIWTPLSADGNVVAA